MNISAKTSVSLTLPQLCGLVGLLISGTVTIVAFLIETNNRLVTIESKLEKRFITRTQATLYAAEVRQRNVGKGLEIPELQAFLNNTD